VNLVFLQTPGAGFDGRNKQKVFAESGEVDKFSASPSLGGGNPISPPFLVEIY
jgi:hypothetical protein